MAMQGETRKEEVNDEVGIVKDHREAMLGDKELNKFLNWNFGPDYVQVICGVNRKGYGEISGKLRVHFSGQFSIYYCTCDCCAPEKVLTPYMFDKHWNFEGHRDWKKNIWVMMENGYKLEVGKSPLIKYYRHAANKQNWDTMRGRFHRDEFVQCSACNKQRRFHLEYDRERIRTYHMALNNKDWTCANWQCDRTCADEEERDSSKAILGCPLSRKCTGCRRCVCFGCTLCRFVECDCRACKDFMYSGAA